MKNVEEIYFRFDKIEEFKSLRKNNKNIREHRYDVLKY